VVNKKNNNEPMSLEFKLNLNRLNNSRANLKDCRSLLIKSCENLLAAIIATLTKKLQDEHPGMKLYSVILEENDLMEYGDTININKDISRDSTVEALLDLSDVTARNPGNTSQFEVDIVPNEADDDDVVNNYVFSAKQLLKGGDVFTRLTLNNSDMLFLHTSRLEASKKKEAKLIKDLENIDKELNLNAAKREELYAKLEQLKGNNESS